MAGPCDQIKKNMTTLDAQIGTLTTAINNAVDPQQKANLQRQLDAATTELTGWAQEFATNGCGRLPQPAPKPNIQILMVTDGKYDHWASFGPGDPRDGYFGLGELIRTLAAPSNYPVTFTVTKAHRDQDPGQFQLLSPEDQALLTPEFPANFKFDEHDLSVYDQIWLFGVGDSNGETELLSNDELQSVHEFMEGGGGVFATGDHQELGSPLCGKAPRVSSMRKWYVSGVPSQLVAPDGLNASRIDTLRHNPSDPPAAGAPVFNFDDQSDDIPQQIFPTSYPIFDNDTISYFIVHPLLDHPSGVVDVLPDHMHEGEIVNPADIDLQKQLRFKGAPFDEYPKDANGIRVRPFIVATGQTFAHITAATEHHNTDPNNSVEIPRSFGIIGAYDGRLTGRGTGRVVVDSTWHHFFDINLIGDPLAPAPKNQGFLASGNGLVALDKIKRYYRNIGLWLAREAVQKTRFAYAVYHLARLQPLSMLIQKNRDYSTKELLQLGYLARSAFHSFAPAPTQLDWLHAHLRSYGFDGFRPTPWESSPSHQAVSGKNQIQMLEAALGGAVLSVARDFNPWGPLGLARTDQQLEAVVAIGVKRGFAALAEQWSLRAEAIAGCAADLRRMTSR
jgi:hypothetical protein